MAHPFAAFAVAGGQGLVKEQFPQLGSIQPFVDHLQKAVKTHRHRDYLWLGKRRIDAVEQRERELGILPRIGGDAILTHPACFLPLDRGGHQPVGYHPPRDDQRRLQNLTKDDDGDGEHGQALVQRATMCPRAMGLKSSKNS